MSAPCVVCGSARLVEQTRLSSRIFDRHTEILLHMPPRGQLGLIEPKTPVYASTCVDCGHVHFTAASREELLLAWEHQQRELAARAS
jgi:hypothetical protein